MVFKPVGVDENGHFPERVEEALAATYAGKGVETTKLDVAAAAASYAPLASAPLTGTPTLNGVPLVTVSNLSAAGDWSSPSTLAAGGSW